MKNRISDRVDKLTASLEEVKTGKVFATLVSELNKHSIRSVTKRSGWRFDWKSEFKDELKVVYKLTLVDTPDVVQGLISIADASDHIFMSLIETAPHNYGRNKKFYGALGNLVAFACKISFEKNYDGVVVFISKTALIDHYSKELGAKVLAGQRMAIFPEEARKLVTLYYKDFIQ